VEGRVVIRAVLWPRVGVCFVACLAVPRAIGGVTCSLTGDQRVVLLSCVTRGPLWKGFGYALGETAETHQTYSRSSNQPLL
jgi:hypothetical protein